MASTESLQVQLDVQRTKMEGNSDNDINDDTFLQFSVKLVGDAASLYGRYKGADLVRLVRDDLAANNLHTKTVA